MNCGNKKYERWFCPFRKMHWTGFCVIFIPVTPWPWVRHASKCWPEIVIQLTEVKCWPDIVISLFVDLSWRNYESLPLKTLAVTFLKWVLFGVQRTSPMFGLFKTKQNKKCSNVKGKSLKCNPTVLWTIWASFIFIF